MWWCGGVVVWGCEGPGVRGRVGESSWAAGRGVLSAKKEGSCFLRKAQVSLFGFVDGSISCPLSHAIYVLTKYHAFHHCRAWVMWRGACFGWACRLQVESM